MLCEVAEDRAVLFPGEIVRSEDGNQSVAVYPLALNHFTSHPAEVSAVMGAIARAMYPPFDPNAPVSDEPHDATLEACKGVAAVLMTTAFMLLQACCVPPIDGTGDPLAPTAAGAWAAMSIDPDIVTPDDEDSGNGEDRPIIPTAFKTSLARLAAIGKTEREIFLRTRIGFDGKRLPYPGWTLRQFQYWSKADDSRRAREQVGVTQSFVTSISACFGGDDGGRNYHEYLDSLRSV